MAGSRLQGLFSERHDRRGLKRGPDRFGANPGWIWMNLPEKMTKYVIWASVITTTLFVVPGRVRPGGRSDRRSRFYAPSRFRRTCDLGFERFGKNDRDRPCPALEGVRLGVPCKFAPLWSIGIRSASELRPRPVDLVMVIYFQTDLTGRYR